MGYSVGRGPFAASSAIRSIRSCSTTTSVANTLRHVDSGEGYNQHDGYQTRISLHWRISSVAPSSSLARRTTPHALSTSAIVAMPTTSRRVCSRSSLSRPVATAIRRPPIRDRQATSWRHRDVGHLCHQCRRAEHQGAHDNELLAICHAPQPHDPLRERGLTLRRIPNHLPGEDARKVPVRSGRNKLEAFSW